MTLLIACLLIYVGKLHWGWYVIATWLWLMKKFLTYWESLFNARDSS